MGLGSHAHRGDDPSPNFAQEESAGRRERKGSYPARPANAAAPASAYALCFPRDARDLAFNRTPSARTGREIDCGGRRLDPAPKIGLPVGTESCDHSGIATDTTRSPINLQDEHLASRKAWSAYINLTTVVHRQRVVQTDQFIAHVWARIEQAKRLRS